MTAYLRRYPQTAADLVADNCTIDLVEERINLVVRITNNLDSNLVARPLGMCEPVVMTASSYPAVHGTPCRMRDLAVHNCLTYTYFGKSPWKSTEAKTGTPSDISVDSNLSANGSMVLLATT